MGENAVTWTERKHETKRYEICKLPEQICTTVPLSGSEEERMLQGCELKLNPNNKNYPMWCNACICTKCLLWWMEYIQTQIATGKEFTNIATDSKKDDCTELANITMPTNPCETGTLKKKF